MNNGTVIWGASGGVPFAKRLHANLAGTEGNSVILSDIVNGFFPVGETNFQTNGSVRGKNVIIVQDVANAYAPGSLNDKLMATFLMADAAKRSGATSLHVVLPYLPYTRQDRPNKKHHEPASAAVVADMFDSIARSSMQVYVHTIDLHSQPVETLYRDARLMNYQTSGVIAEFVKKNLCEENLVVGSTDTAGSVRNKPLAEALNSKLVGAVKIKDPVTYKILEHYVQGDVKGKHVLVHDDMIDTGGTMLETVDLMLMEGAIGVSVSASHLLFTKNAEQKFAEYLKGGRIKTLITTNSVYKDEEFKARNPGIVFLPVEHIVANGIRSIMEGRPVGYE